MNLKRFFYLDNLKVLLIVLVIFHHAGQAYGDGGFWGYTPSNPAEYSPWLWRFFAVNASFLMGLFFFISGYFIPGSYDRQGFWKFIGKKFLRLGVPLALMVGFLTWYAGGKIDMGPMWFLEHLLFYCIVYAVYRVVAGLLHHSSSSSVDAVSKKSNSARPMKFWPALLTIFGFAILLSILSLIVRTYSKQDSWIWLFGFLLSEPAHLPQYIMMVVLGMVAFRRNWLERLPNKVGVVCAVIALVISCCMWFAPKDSFILNLLCGNWYAFDSFTCIFMSVAFLWLFRNFANITNGFLKWCSGQAFGAYIFHVVLMTVFQFITDKLWMGGAIGKTIFVGISTCILVFGFTWLLRLIPGVKKVL